MTKLLPEDGKMIQRIALLNPKLTLFSAVSNQYDTLFRDRAAEALSLARAVVDSRDSDRNLAVPLSAMFPRGAQDLVAHVFMKAGRLVSAMTALTDRGDDVDLHFDMQDQALDLINYTSWLYAALTLERDVRASRKASQS